MVPERTPSKNYFYIIFISIIKANILITLCFRLITFFPKAKCATYVSNVQVQYFFLVNPTKRHCLRQIDICIV